MSCLRIDSRSKAFLLHLLAEYSLHIFFALRKMFGLRYGRVTKQHPVTVGGAVAHPAAAPKPGILNRDSADFLFRG
jgi:hypothetical protein